MKNFIVHFHEYGGHKGHFVVSLDGRCVRRSKLEVDAKRYVKLNQNGG